MFLPDPSNLSLIDMARELSAMAIKTESKTCAICTPDYVCFWHRGECESRTDED